jgi:hypothetical protein
MRNLFAGMESNLIPAAAAACMIFGIAIKPYEAGAKAGHHTHSVILGNKPLRFLARWRPR